MAEFDEIYDREFKPIRVRKAFSAMNLYAGQERNREFDLASTVLMVRAGQRIHSLERWTTADKIDTDLKASLNIATFASNRVHAHMERATEETDSAPFYLGKRKSRRSRGLKVNAKADIEYQYDQDRWISDNQTAIDSALQAGANIVCLGEFDFPPLDVDSAIKTKNQSADSNMRHRRWIKERLLQHGKPAIVFAGSAHEWTKSGCANVGEIFIADDDGRGGLKVHFKRYLKRVAAGGLGETLSQVTSPILPYFGTSLGKIAVLICIDAFDPSVIYSIFASSRGTDRVGMILVPSYNPSQKLVRSCQQLSYLANCAVVYVNAMGTAPHEKAQVFLSGISLKTWRAQLTNVENMVKMGAGPDRRAFDSVAGVRTWARLVHLAKVGREISIKSLGAGDQLMLWTIPHGFASEAAIVMNEKYPFSRGRIITSLASDEDVA